jgi:hypothetical protein
VVGHAVGRPTIGWKAMRKRRSVMARRSQTARAQASATKPERPSAKPARSSASGPSRVKLASAWRSAREACMGVRPAACSGRLRVATEAASPASAAMRAPSVARSGSSCEISP